MAGGTVGMATTTGTAPFARRDVAQARALLEAKVRELEARAELAKAEVVRVQAAFAAAAEAATPQAVDSELARENERLRTRLAEAGEKTAQLGERVRFLRQQIGQGAER